jgi:hypothetical protein
MNGHAAAMRALLAVALCSLAQRGRAQDTTPAPLPPPAAEASGCTTRDVIRGQLMNLPVFAARCPLPAPAELLGEAPASALSDDAALAAAKQDALHVLVRRADTEGAWGRVFASRVEAALSQLPRQCSQIFDIGFASVAAPLPNESQCGCAFVAASDGDSAHACYRFPQPGAAAPATCDVPRMQLVDLPDWPAVARALSLHRLAFAALTKLNASCVTTAVDRLELAEHAWLALARNGYVQYPWELAVSRLFSADYGNYSACFATDKHCDGEEGLDPTRARVIFLHPGIGFGFRGFGEKDGNPQSAARAVVALEAAGATFYPRNFGWYLGVSAAVGFQDADFADPRLGAIVHLTRWLQVGYLHGVRTRSQHQGTLYLSIDAIGWANRAIGLVQPHN